MNLDFFLKTNIQNICNDLKTKLVSNHIANLTFINKNSLYFNFSFYRQELLFINLTNNNPFIGLIKKEKTLSNFNKDIAFQFRHFIKDSYINDIRLLNDDTILIFDLFKKIDEFDHRQFHLIIELIFNKTNLILCDENFNIILVFKPSSILQKRDISIGKPYQIPDKYIKNIDFKDDLTLKEYYAYGEKLFQEKLMSRKEEKFKKLHQFILNKIKLLNRKKIILNQEIVDAKKDLIYEELGNACYYYNQNELEQLFLENNKQFKKDEDIKLVASSCFKKYKKAKSKIDNSEKQLNICNDDLQYFSNLLIQYENGDEDDLLQLESLLLPEKIFNKNEKQIIKKTTPYQIKIEGCTILFGKNDIQNDYLTFHIAKDDDLFFHIHPYSGAHVIIKGNNPSDNLINIACQICLILSKKTASDVIFTKKKYVKKGHKLGQVILKKYQILKINNVDDSVKELIFKANKI